MPELANVSVLTPKINGNIIAGMMGDIDEIIVDSSLHMPDMFTIRLQDKSLEWVDHDDIDFGKPVVIEAKAASSIGGGRGTLINGTITSIEPEFSATGVTMLTIRGYDKSNRLHYNKQSRTFTNQRDTDIAKTIAGDVGLTSDIDDSKVRYEYVLQNNQTNIEFLAERARRIGFQVFTMEGKLYFKKGDFALSGPIPILTLGVELRNFRPRMTVAGQASKVRVLGWDPGGKKMIKSEAGPNSALNQGGATETGGTVAKSALGNSELWAVLSTDPVATVDEASALAEGLANDISAHFVDAEGVCFGDPLIKAGMKISLKGLGDRFSGKYFVTSATHIYNASVGYETHFTVSGRQPNTFNHLLSSRNGHGASAGRIDGVVVGLVTSVSDEKNLGRVKVKFPWLLDGKNTEIETTWARIAAAGAGADTKGMYFLPEINDEVLVAFEHGDVNRPYLLGGLWNGTDKPPLPNSTAAQGGKVVQRIIQSRTGHKVILDDSDKPSVMITDNTGKNFIKIDTSTNAMEIKMAGNLTIEAGGNIDIKSRGSITLDATRDITQTTKGMFKVDATRSATISANMDLTLSGKLTAKVEGGSTADLKGGVGVNITGGMSVSVTGALIKLN